MSSKYSVESQPILGTAIDPENRDPNGINKHLQLDFFNVIGEPDSSAYSFDSLHQFSHQVYHYTKIFIYRFLAIFLSLPLMICWGLIFGSYAYLMIWIVTPMRRLTQSVIAESGLYVQIICDAIISPLYRSSALLFSNMQISLSHRSVDHTKTINV